jgi:hypothetical protein
VATSAATEPTERQDSSVRTDILPGVELAIEEVEPGVLRVVGDGQLDLDSYLDTVANAWYLKLATGPDGSVWVADGERLHRLGDPTTDTEFRAGIDLEVAPDGTVWQIAKGRPYTIRSFDGSRWTTWMDSRKRNPRAVEVSPDGMVWAMWQERPRAGGRYEREDTFLGHLDGGEWKKASRWFPRGAKTQGIWPGDLTITDDGEIRGYGGGGFVLARFVDGSWKEIDGPWKEAAVEGWPRQQGPDGTVWVTEWSVMHDGQPAADGTDTPFLRRSDGGGWQSWDVSESIPEARSWASMGEAYVAPDGALWVSPERPHRWSGEDRVGTTGDGLVRFDGTSTHHVLRGHSASIQDFGPDGYVWTIAAREDGPDHLYVITPEAVAARE